LLLTVLSVGPVARGDALAKLKPDKLEAVRQSLQKLRGEWRKLERPGPYTEYRANLHVHSKLSHDSRGTIEEIVAAAKTVGTRVLLFTEHPAPHYDIFKDGHKGVRDGVLLIPGAETKGFLASPKASLRGLDGGTPQEFADVVRRQDGLVFLSHLEERMDWEIRGLTGTEIYNTHADFKDEKKLIAAMRNPLWLLQTAELFRKYPQEAFSAPQDYPANNLNRGDRFGKKPPHTGTAATAAHKNAGLAARLLDGGRARAEDALGKKLREADVALIPPLAALAK